MKILTQKITVKAKFISIVYIQCILDDKYSILKFTMLSANKKIHNLCEIINRNAIIVVSVSGKLMSDKMKQEEKKNNRVSCFKCYVKQTPDGSSMHT